VIKNLYSKIEIKTLMLTVLIIFLVTSCIHDKKVTSPQTKIGTLIGVKASFGLNEAMKGELKNVKYEGIVIVKLDDGTEVNAVCDKELYSKLRGGQRLKIIPINSEVWKVIEIINTEAVKKK